MNSPLQSWRLMTLTITPNSAFVLADSIDPVVYGGNPPQTVECMKLAIRLNPHHQHWYFWNLGWVRHFAANYDAAKASFEQMN
ncbi:hypothetical protein [uncultured Ruegeria sp.]|uniref:hypothetical protein n=1 Tax=uncultured Ruegeria sp. TaxID=259304 RepID=UPI0026273864|nr:hypothetical protein [uncultured Ruegeria sp.]